VIAHRRISKLSGKLYLNGGNGICCSRVEEEVEVKAVIDICESLLVAFSSKLDVANRGDLILGNRDGLSDFSGKEMIIIIFLGV
jgi:hypothetical protein